MRALVTGGTGFVGAHIVRALLDRGASVRCLVRSTSPDSALAGLEVERVVGDLRDFDAVRSAVQGREVVFHCAADYRLWVPDPAEMFSSNVDGTRNLLRAAYECRVERVVYTSTVGALGHTANGIPADETTPVDLRAMVGPYKKSKFLAERVADEWVARGLPVTIVNPSTPIGELDIKPTATGQVIVDFLDGRMPAYVRTGLNLIDVRDVASGHLLAAEHGRIGERYILGHRNMTLDEIFAALARLSGRPAPRIRLPHWLPWTVGAAQTAVAYCTGRPPRVAFDAVRLSRRPMFFRSDKAVHELGLPQSPIEAALGRAVEWFRDAGYLRVCQAS